MKSGDARSTDPGGTCPDRGGGVLQCDARELTTPYARTSEAKTDQNQPMDDREHFIQMDGQEVYRFATRRVPQCIEEALSDAGLTIGACVMTW